MEAKHMDYTKKIFNDLRHLKYVFAGMWWTEHKTNEEILHG